MSRSFLLAAIAMAAVFPTQAQEKRDPKEPEERVPAYAARDKMVKEYGGNTESEAAVARGLAWLARQQLKDGSWKFDGSSTDQVAATSMAVLPLINRWYALTKRDRYGTEFASGVDWLLTQQIADTGSFRGASNMYAHALATIALCEAYQASKDDKLKEPATKAVRYILKGQAKNGSWGYRAGSDGDTSILGWQVQALAAARLAGIPFDKEQAYPSAEKFLISVSVEAQSRYGYREKGQSPSLSAAALLSRYHLGWAPDNDSIRRGADFLISVRPPNKGDFDMYYYHYATQILRTHGGDLWQKRWNPRMRDMLVDMQHKGGPPERLGSWDKDGGFIGASCGRLGTTALAVLTLQVYYRLPPPGVREPDGKDPKK